VKNHPALKGLNLDFSKMGKFDVRPGPLLTKELLFLGESGNIGGGSGGPMFRAYDKRDGKGRLGRQDAQPRDRRADDLRTERPPVCRVHRVQTRRAGGDGGADAGWRSENGAAPAGGVPLAAAPPSTKLAAQAVSATWKSSRSARPSSTRCAPSAMARAASAFSGGSAPPITNRTDYANIARVIAQGQGEMPALAAALQPNEIEAVAKYVVKTLGPQPRTGPRPAAGRQLATDRRETDKGRRNPQRMRRPFVCVSDQRTRMRGRLQPFVSGKMVGGDGIEPPTSCV
jgi:mono/diheme cytochrome c family protein